MSARSPLALSLALNASLVLLLAGMTWVRLRPARLPDRAPPARHSVAASIPVLDPSPGESEAPAGLTSPSKFHWSAVESADYRQYIANLRGIGCPERLLRDLVVADLQELYARKRADLRPPAFEPWTSHDVRGAAEREHQARVQALDQEHRAVVRELLGFPWEAEGFRAWRDEELLWILLGFVTDDQAIQVAGLVEPLEAEARQVRERAYGVLLAEDQAALRAQATRFESELAAILTPQQQEEFNLRLQAFVASFSGKDLHFEAAGLTALQAREVVRLSFLKGNLLEEELFDLDQAGPEDPGSVTDRQLEFETQVARLLGPQGYAAYARAQDERFREVLGFSQARQFPEEVAIKAWEIRQEAEAEAEALIHALPDTGSDLDAEAQQARLEALQESATLALTALFGANHIRAYVDEQGKWLEQLGGQTVPEAQSPAR